MCLRESRMREVYPWDLLGPTAANGSGFEARENAANTANCTAFGGYIDRPGRVLARRQLSSGAGGPRVGHDVASVRVVLAGVDGSRPGNLWERRSA